MNTDSKTIEQLLENPPRRGTPIVHLVNWSYNEDFRTGTAWLEFLDLTGISTGYYGEYLNRPGYRAGYLEGDYLADALKAWANYPQEIEEYAIAIMDADD